MTHQSVAQCQRAHGVVIKCYCLLLLLPLSTYHAGASSKETGDKVGGCKVDGCWIDSGVEVVLTGRVVLVHVVQACLLRLGHKGSILSLKLPSFFV